MGAVTVRAATTAGHTPAEGTPIANHSAHGPSCQLMPACAVCWPPRHEDCVMPLFNCVLFADGGAVRPQSVPPAPSPHAATSPSSKSTFAAALRDLAKNSAADPGAAEQLQRRGGSTPVPSTGGGSVASSLLDVRKVRQRLETPCGLSFIISSAGFRPHHAQRLGPVHPHTREAGVQLLGLARARCRCRCRPRCCARCNARCRVPAVPRHPASAGPAAGRAARPRLPPRTVPRRGARTPGRPPLALRVGGDGGT